MRTHTRLRSLFQTLATLTVTPVALSGCGGPLTVSAPPMDAGSDGEAPRDADHPEASTPGPDARADVVLRPDSSGVDSGADAVGDSGRDASVVDVGRDASVGDSGPDASVVDVGPDASVVDAGPDAGAFDLQLCPAGATYPLLEGVTPGTAVDYLELRTEYATFGGSDAGAPMIAVTARRGTPCATATDPSRCASDFAAVRAMGWRRPSAGGEPPNTEYVVYTRGNLVGAVTTLDALAAFVSPVDNPHDAALLAIVRGHRITCGTRNARAITDGFELETHSGHTCGPGTGIDRHRVRVDRMGALSIVATTRIMEGDPMCAIGRRPAGLEAVRHGRVDELGAWFAAAAHLEAASVYAFDRLARELEGHGAPDELVREARRARADEVRHAKTTTALATRFGGSPVTPRVEALEPRGLLEIALENAVEGCVRETFGALVATVQRERAADPGIAHAMDVIAEDETRHAALAWDVAAWLRGRLGEEDRARVLDAQREAIATLRRELEASPSRELVERAGMPTAGEARRLLDALVPSVWAA